VGAPRVGGTLLRTARRLTSSGPRPAAGCGPCCPQAVGRRCRPAARPP